MKVRELGIPDAYEISTDVFPDDRGLFVNPFRAGALADAIGRPLDVRQTNHSSSKRGVARGVHFSLLPPGQAKYVYVPRGAALDILAGNAGQQVHALAAQALGIAPRLGDAGAELLDA